MVNLGQLFLSLLPLSRWTGIYRLNPYLEPSQQQNVELPQQAEVVLSSASKSIAIVGGGSAGLAVLKTIFNLPPETRSGWEVVLFEQRRDVGGVWLPDPPGKELSPHHLPETPLYPGLHTNTPHPTMTYPHFTYPPNTSLFPSHTGVEAYLRHYAEHFGLRKYIRVNHTVFSADWEGDGESGKWKVEVHSHGADEQHHHRQKWTFDHLIVANGHYHYPYIPQWNGTEEWLANTPSEGHKREITHSIYYREPDKYTTRRVVIVGAGASARDVVIQVAPVAPKAYLSVHSKNPLTYPFPNISTIISKPAISHFTKDSIVFEDGTSVTDVDSVVLGTGYQNLVPFLSPPHAHSLLIDNEHSVNSTTAEKLTTNKRYIFPLWKYIFSASPALPPTALSFIGIPTLIANCPSDHAQGLLVAHALANASLLPPRETLLSEVVERENFLRSLSFDPYVVGHRLVASEGESADYQDDIVQFLQDRGIDVPVDKKWGKYVEPWRRRPRGDLYLLKQGWERVQALGEEAQWLAGVETEEEWVDLMQRLTEWERAQQKEEGRSFVEPVWDPMDDPVLW